MKNFFIGIIWILAFWTILAHADVGVYVFKVDGTSVAWYDRHIDPVLNKQDCIDDLKIAYDGLPGRVLTCTTL